MKILKKLLIGAAILACPMSMTAQDENFFIFLCIGQSNMVGQGEISAQDMNVSDHFLSLSATDGKDRKVGQWRKAVPPICRQDTKLSPVDYFGRTMLDNLPEKCRVGVIHVAVDGCAIDLFDRDNCQTYINNVTEDWKKKEIAAYGGNPYKRLIELAEKAMDEGDIRGILFHQGETDAYDAKWLQKVKKVYNNIIEDLDLDRNMVPFVAGEVAGYDQQGTCARANAIINQLPQTFKQAYVVSSAGCEVSPDKVHFSADGYRTLGQRYGLKMLQAMGYDVVAHDISVTTRNAGPTIDVEGGIDNHGILMVTATSPLDKVELVSFSGKTLKVIPMNGAINATVNTEEFPDEPTLVVVFYGQNGATVSLDIQRQ